MSNPLQSKLKADKPHGVDPEEESLTPQVIMAGAGEPRTWGGEILEAGGYNQRSLSLNFCSFLAPGLLAANLQHQAPDILYVHEKHLQSEYMNIVNRYKRKKKTPMDFTITAKIKRL